MIGDGHHLFGEPGVHLCIAHGAEGRWTQAAVHIAHIIAAGCPNKRHVNPPLPPFDGAGPAAVGLEHHGLGQDALPGDGLRQLSPHAAGLDAGDDARADIVDQTGVVLAQGGGTQSQVPDAHGRDLRHDLREHQVAVAQVVVKGDGHPILQPHLFNGGPQAGHQLAGRGRLAGDVLATPLARLQIGAELADPLHLGGDAALDAVGYKFHVCYTPSPIWSRTRRAFAITGASTILPSTVNTPAPACSAARMASITRRAWATSSSSGV